MSRDGLASFELESVEFGKFRCVLSKTCSGLLIGCSGGCAFIHPWICGASLFYWGNEVFISAVNRFQLNKYTKTFELVPPVTDYIFMDCSVQFYDSVLTLKTAEKRFDINVPENIGISEDMSVDFCGMNLSQSREVMFQVSIRNHLVPSPEALNYDILGVEIISQILV